MIVLIPVTTDLLYTIKEVRVGVIELIPYEKQRQYLMEIQ